MKKINNTFDGSNVEHLMKIIDTFLINCNINCSEDVYQTDRGTIGSLEFAGNIVEYLEANNLLIKDDDITSEVDTEEADFSGASDPVGGIDPEGR